MKKRIALILMLSVVLVALTGCGGGSSTDEVVEQAKTYDIYFSIKDIAGDPINNSIITVDGEELRSEGNIYQTKLKEGKHTIKVEETKNFTGIETEMNVDKTGNKDIFLIGKLLNNFSNPNYNFTVKYPYDWETEKELINENEFIGISHPKLNNPLFYFGKIENGVKLNNEIFELFITRTEEELIKNYDSVDSKIKTSLFNNIAYEYEISFSNSKIKLLAGYFDNTFITFYYMDSKEYFNQRDFIYDEMIKTIQIK